MTAGPPLDGKPGAVYPAAMPTGHGPALAALGDALGSAAADALLAEAALTGKPGLVCPGARGAHDDMDHGLMAASAEALRPWFRRFAALSFELRDSPPAQALVALRPLGVEAESDMFRITRGVNTHKGAVFTLGLLVAASARVLGGSAARRGPAGNAIRLEAAAMAAGIVGSELAAKARPTSYPPSASRSAGERLYAELGTKGVRGQAESAFPVLATILPILRRARKPASHPAAPSLPSVLIEVAPEVEVLRLEALLASMTELEDSCILNRGGPEALAFVRGAAAAALAAGAPHNEEGRHLLRELDSTLVSRHLSPGGSADLLAAGIYLDAIEASFPSP